MAYHAHSSQDDASLLTEESGSANKTKEESWSWKQGLWLDFWMTLSIFLALAGFFIWAEVQMRHQPGASAWGLYGFNVLSKATDCDQLKQQRTGLSFAVNFLAAVTGLFSSHSLQVLSAPTRKQLNACHKAKKYMEVGVQSLHNVVSRRLGWWKTSLWLALMIMALPFHLL